MLNVHDSMKKLIKKCELYYEGHLISREALLRDYASFLAENFEKKHNVVFSLHTGSICFDIITIVFTAISNVIFNQENVEDFINSLSIGDAVLYEKTRCKFEGIVDFPGEEKGRIKLCSESTTKGVVLKTRDFIKEENWHKIQPYHGDSTRWDARGIRTDNSKRNDFLLNVLDLQPDEIPSYLKKSSVIIMNRERAESIINNLEIEYDKKRIKLSEIMPISYCSENEEYPFAGNPGKIEPSIKIANNLSTARSIVTGSWAENENWENDILGVSILGFSAISRAQTEAIEIMKRRKLKYVFVSYNISSEEGETLLDQVEDASVFACTNAYLKSLFPVYYKNPYTIELSNQVLMSINHQTTPVAVKTFDCDWNVYRQVQIALARLRHSGYKEAEDFVPLAYSVMNLIITSVFPFELMERMVESGDLEVESPQRRIARLSEMITAFAGEAREVAVFVVDFLKEGYDKLFVSSPKQEALFDLLKKHRNEKAAIIVPKAYYGNLLYNLGVLDYFDDATNLFISTANKFDASQQYDVIIAIGAFGGKKFDPFRCLAAPLTYVMVSAVEENIFKYRKKLAAAIEQKFNEFAKIRTDCEYAVEEEEVYSNGVTEDEVVEVIKSDSDVFKYISGISESRPLELLSSSAAAHYSTIDISHIATCEDGENIFFTKKYIAFVFDSAKENVIETPVDKLSPGDTVIFKSNNNETKDIVTALLDKYIDEYKSASEDVQVAYLKSRHWKEALRRYKKNNELTFKELAKQLEGHGSKKNEVTIQSWLSEDSYIVGPQDDETYTAIAYLTEDADMLEDPMSFRRACDKIRKVRIGILKLIAKTIVSKYSGKLSAEDDLAKVVSENIGDISTLVQIETITPVNGKKAPVNMINRPIIIS